MHILHIIDGLGLGGAERMLVDLANTAAADGHSVSVCVTRSDTTIASELSPNVGLLVLARKRRFEISAARVLSAWAKERRIDVLHVHMRHTLSFVLALRVLRYLSLPIVFHDHYGTIEVDTTVPLWFRLGHPLIERYVGVYEKLSQWARSAGMSPARTITIGNAIDLSRLATTARTSIKLELGVPEGLLLGAMVATIRPDKNIETLVDAVAATKNKDKTRIAVIGSIGDPTYAAHCQALLAASPARDVVHFVGPRMDVPAVLPSADYALLSSHTESGPLVLIEYLAAGLPLVATAVGEIGRRLGELGLPGMVPPRDPAAFGRALDELLALSIDGRRARGEAGRHLLQKTWDIRVVMPRWYEVYTAAIHEFHRS